MWMCGLLQELSEVEARVRGMAAAGVDAVIVQVMPRAVIVQVIPLLFQVIQPSPSYVIVSMG